jgi:hypothetical protein
MVTSSPSLSNFKGRGIGRVLYYPMLILIFVASKPSSESNYGGLFIKTTLITI